jgi:hypothetical protein
MASRTLRRIDSPGTLLHVDISSVDRTRHMVPTREPRTTPKPDQGYYEPAGEVSLRYIKSSYWTSEIESLVIANQGLGRNLTVA